MCAAPQRRTEPNIAKAGNKAEKLNNLKQACMSPKCKMLSSRVPNDVIGEGGAGHTLLHQGPRSHPIHLQQREACTPDTNYVCMDKLN